MTEASRKRCAVAYATRERQYLWIVDLPAKATIADALAAARRVADEQASGQQTAGMEDVPWNTAPVGVFGELRDRADRPMDGDRIELYRPLRSDPRERRRQRVQRARGQKA
jgi:uncharacterized protein